MWYSACGRAREHRRRLPSSRRRDRVRQREVVRVVLTEALGSKELGSRDKKDEESANGGTHPERAVSMRFGCQD
jgi:hypothetical protein